MLTLIRKETLSTVRLDISLWVAVEVPLGLTVAMWMPQQLLQQLSSTGLSLHLSMSLASLTVLYRCYISALHRTM